MICIIFYGSNGSRNDLLIMFINSKDILHFSVIKLLLLNYNSFSYLDRHLLPRLQNHSFSKVSEIASQILSIAVSISQILSIAKS